MINPFFPHPSHHSYLNFPTHLPSTFYALILTFYAGLFTIQAALNMGSASLAKDLAPAGVCVQVIHPGMVDTDMTAQWGGGTFCPSPNSNPNQL